MTHTIFGNKSEIQWKAMGNRALAAWRFDLGEECRRLRIQVLLLVAVRDTHGLRVLAGKAEKGQDNFALTILLQLGDSAACVDLLTKTERAPEAAPSARTYVPIHTPKTVQP